MFALCCVVKSERRTFFSLQLPISLFLGSDLALMHGLPPCICWTNVWPAAVIKEQRGEKKKYRNKKNRGHWQFHALLLCNSITGSQAESYSRGENNYEAQPGGGHLQYVLR